MGRVTAEAGGWVMENSEQDLARGLHTAVVRLTRHKMEVDGHSKLETYVIQSWFRHRSN